MNAISAEQKLREVARLKHFALSTEDSYAGWLRRYCAYVKKLSPALASERKMELFLTALAKDDVSASTQNQAFNALLFFYQDCLGQKLQGVDSLRAKRAAFIRRAPPESEVRSLLNDVRDESAYPVRLIVKLLYGCGLRITEPLSIRIRDLDLPGSRFIIRQGKGRKDRMVAIPCLLIREIEAQIATAKVTWQRDVAAQVPIKLPSRMDRKYPGAKFSWHWAWLFPQIAPCQDPRTDQTVRWHMLESCVQRAVKNSCRRLNLDIKPHELRHAYATHSLNHQQNPRAIQEAMGHKSLETTMGYMHAETLSVRSPLETLA